MITSPDNGAIATGSANSPMLSYFFNFTETGTYYLWIRGWGDADNGGQNNSLHAGLNGVLSNSADNIDGFPSGWHWSQSTRDGSSAQLSIANTGIQTVNLWMREDGLAIDKLILSNDPNYRPQGSGPGAFDGSPDDGTTTVSNAPSGSSISVSGNVISWPDDGWYQVLSANDYAAVCNGGSSCEVQAGSYIVINHSTGRRFENIVVAVNGDSSQPANGNNAVPTTDLSIDGNIISWPNNGWYQVLRATDFSSVCNGGDSCAVDEGSYIVINHTTGQRYENVTVPTAIQNSGSQAQQDGGVTVNGNTISWPDDGWYQVQSGTDFSNVCNGGRSCVVPVGTYVVINHSNGRRYENIRVGG